MSDTKTQSRYQVLIIGGGTAGISVAARLRKKLPAGSIAIVEPSSKHYYQPLWTLVGGGVGTREATGRDEQRLIPSGVQWLHDAVATLDPDANRVVLAIQRVEAAKSPGRYGCKCCYPRGLTVRAGMAASAVIPGV